MKLGIMQGRLSASETGALQEFPRREWEEEFRRAAEAGFESIQWLYDSHGEDVNPIATDAGVRRIRELAAEHRVAVRSLCAHYLIERPHDRERVRWLIHRCAEIGVDQVVLPFLDGVEFDPHLLDAEGVEVLAEGVPDAAALNYDTGNDPLDWIGPNVRGVHLKDRDACGDNVRPGTGAVDFPEVFARLRDIGYDGELVFETPRPPAGREVEWGRSLVEFASTIAT